MSMLASLSPLGSTEICDAIKSRAKDGVFDSFTFSVMQ